MACIIMLLKYRDEIGKHKKKKIFSCHELPFKRRLTIVFHLYVCLVYYL